MQFLVLSFPCVCYILIGKIRKMKRCLHFLLNQKNEILYHSEIHPYSDIHQVYFLKPTQTLCSGHSRRLITQTLDLPFVEPLLGERRGGTMKWRVYVCLSLLLHVQTYHLRNLLFQDILLFPSLLRFINKCWDLTRNKVRCMYSIICREGYKCEVDSLLSFIHPILTSLCFRSISLMSAWGCGPN